MLKLLHNAHEFVHACTVYRYQLACLLYLVEVILVSPPLDYVDHWRGSGRGIPLDVDDII